MSASDRQSPRLHSVTLTLVASVVACAGLLSACTAPAPSSKVYSSSEAMRKTQTEYAVVESVQSVTIQSEAGLGGATGGAIAGGSAGAQVGSGNGRIAAAAVGALAGAAIGKASEEFMERKAALEITVRMPDGAILTIVQTDEGQKFVPGQRVKLLTSAGKTRVSPL